MRHSLSLDLLRADLTVQACNRQSVYCVPLYDTLGEDALEYILQHAEITICFVQGSKLPNLAKVLAKVQGLVKTVVHWGEVDSAAVQVAPTICPQIAAPAHLHSILHKSSTAAHDERDCASKPGSSGPGSSHCNLGPISLGSPRCAQRACCAHKATPPPPRAQYLICRFKRPFLLPVSALVVSHISSIAWSKAVLV